MRHVHPITHRGFFSEYLIALWVKLHCDLNGLGFALAFDRRSIVSRDFAARHFNLDILPSFAGRAFTLRYRLAKVARKGLRPVVQLPQPLWNRLWCETEMRSLSNKLDLIHAMQRLHFAIWQPDEMALSVFRSLGESFKACSYVALHVRRGDKLVNESRFVSAEEYCALIPRELRSYPVLVVTDDHRAFEEVGQHLRVSGVDVKVATTAPPDAVGYYQKSFLQKSIAARDKAASALLADFELLCGAAFVVCSGSSNVGKTVHVARAGSGIVSVDSPFSLGMPPNRWPVREALVVEFHNRGIAPPPADLPDLISRVDDELWESGATVDASAARVVQSYLGSGRPGGLAD